MTEPDAAAEDRASLVVGDQGELSDELLDLVVGGLDPELARVRYEHFELALATGQIPIEALRPLRPLR